MATGADGGVWQEKLAASAAGYHGEGVHVCSTPSAFNHGQRSQGKGGGDLPERIENRIVFGLGRIKFGLGRYGYQHIPSYSNSERTVRGSGCPGVWRIWPSRYVRL